MTKRNRRPYLTWRCDVCGFEFDYFTYGGPCPGAEGEGCTGELHHKKVLDRNSEQTAAREGASEDS